jgi:hypothetical protein
MRPLTWVSGSFSARLLAARLTAEGIDVQLRGAVDSPYGLTVGPLARVDVWVPEDQLEDAKLVMLATEVDGVLSAPREWEGAPDVRPRRWPLWVAMALLVVLVVVPLLRLAVSWLTVAFR